jgi:hypothetical protein
MKRFETTPGRLRIGALLPKNFKTPFDIVNRLLRKKEVGEVIDTVYRHCGQKESVIFCDQIMSLGFTEAFKAGISFGKDDMLIPDAKWTIVNQTRDQVKEFEQQYMDGLITQGEKYNKVVDAWSKCSDLVADAMMAEISAVRKDDAGRELEPNSVYMMSHSGARGSPAQMKQLAGMRGLMAKPSGEIIETPIVSNFKEGLTVLEYFNSTHGARKGLADTALKTANSGYLTRRLVDVAQDCIVKIDDCGTDRHITTRAAINDGEVVSPLSERILGRVAAEDVLDPKTQEVIHKRNDLIEERDADRIEVAGVLEVKIRSPLTCEADDGICAKCYGRDLARGTMVNVGEAVGIIAAQSIGEPGTQLTMRTFHIGGIAQGGSQSFLEANTPGRDRAARRHHPHGCGRRPDRDGPRAAARDRRRGRRRPRGAQAHLRHQASREGRCARSSAAPSSPSGTPTRCRSSPRRRAWRSSSISCPASRCARRPTTPPASPRRSSPTGGRCRAAPTSSPRSSSWTPPPGSRCGSTTAIPRSTRCRSTPSSRSRTARSCGPATCRAHPARGREDQGHHGRSAAGGRALRGPAAEGSRDHRGDLGPCPVRQGLQEQAPDHHRADRGGARADRVHGAKGQAHPRPGRRLHPEG